MRKLRIGIIDLVSKGPTRALWARVMNANFASIMPQVIAVWCKDEGHDATLLCYTGFENLIDELPDKLDLVFIGAFTESAQLAYALSSQFQSRGAVTVLGGPHARCYPQDAQKYFDYVLGFTDKTVVREVLHDCSQHRPTGIHIAAQQQPANLPGVHERWEFIESTLRKAPLIKMVPMLGSLGCPYTCSFCIDSTVPYQPLDFDVMKEDLKFLLTKFKRPLVGWHDPNFGVRFDAYMSAIEEAVPPNSIDFVAESSLSILTEPHMKRLKHNGFKALLPGIESWYDLGEKSRTGQAQGMEKVRRVSDHVNMILRYIPYVQTNFVLGLDGDSGCEPFELTKRFVDLTPGAFPGYSLLSAFGQAAPLNLEYQRANRVIAFPFHFLNNNGAMNLKPMGYSWSAFYEHVIDLTKYTFSPRAILRRIGATEAFIPRWLNVVRAVSSEGYGRINYYGEIRRRLESDAQFRLYFDQETAEIPPFYAEQVQKDLGPMWKWLPQGALNHDPNAYLNAELECGAATLEVERLVA
ncbi:MAG: radical SAM protein [Bacteroidota bacterium]